MTKWHAHVAHMAKHMNMVEAPLWWGALGPGSLGPSLNPALHRPIIGVREGILLRGQKNCPEKKICSKNKQFALML